MHSVPTECLVGNRQSKTLRPSNMWETSSAALSLFSHTFTPVCARLSEVIGRWDGKLSSDIWNGIFDHWHAWVLSDSKLKKSMALSIPTRYNWKMVLLPSRCHVVVLWITITSVAGSPPSIQPCKTQVAEFCPEEVMLCVILRHERSLASVKLHDGWENQSIMHFFFFLLQYMGNELGRKIAQPSMPGKIPPHRKARSSVAMTFE